MRGRIARMAALLLRILAALLGGYAVAGLASMAVLALPLEKPQAVLTGMQLSFLVYAVAVIWVFAARSALRAWTGLVVVAVPLSLAAWSVRSLAAASS